MTRAGLVARVLLLVLPIEAAAYAVLWAFAPRWLLLDVDAADATGSVVAGAAAGAVGALSLAIVLFTRRVRLERDAEGRDVEGHALLELFGLPARVASAHVAVTSLAAAVTLLDGVRPKGNDLYIQGALVILTVAVVGTAALPIYVATRSLVARAIEAAPASASNEAIGLLEQMPDRLLRVRRRFLTAVAAPVAFVAVGASLLVYAHTRAFETRARLGDAQMLARGALDLVSGRPDGRLDAMQAARRLGYYVDVQPDPAPAHAGPGAELGELALSVPLDDGTATVRLDPATPSSETFAFALAAILAATLAAWIGARIGAALSEDVQLATREIEELGAADVIRGSGIQRDARFAPVGALRDAIDRLGAVFRQFAAVQARAIDQRGATERMRGLFLASMSHDLKGPLNAILGFAELTSRQPLAPAQKESVAIIEQRGRELLALVQIILDSARVEAGQLALEREWTMVGDVVMSAVLDARELIEGAEDKDRAEISAEVQPGVPKVYADATRLVTALTAILSSCVRLAPGGAVRVRATLPEDADRLRVDVEARGRGALGEERDRIFEAFKDPTRARRHGALGLGLSLARAIVEMHRGSIDVELGDEGSLVFRVWLPVDPPEARTGQYPAQYSG